MDNLPLGLVNCLGTLIIPAKSLLPYNIMKEVISNYIYKSQPCSGGDYMGWVHQTEEIIGLISGFHLPQTATWLLCTPFITEPTGKREGINMLASWLIPVTKGGWWPLEWKQEGLYLEPRRFSEVPFTTSMLTAKVYEKLGTRKTEMRKRQCGWEFRSFRKERLDHSMKWGTKSSWGSVCWQEKYGMGSWRWKLQISARTLWPITETRTPVVLHSFPLLVIYVCLIFSSFLQI